MTALEAAARELKLDNPNLEERDLEWVLVETVGHIQANPSRTLGPRECGDPPKFDECLPMAVGFIKEWLEQGHEHQLDIHNPADIARLLTDHTSAMVWCVIQCKLANEGTEQG
jgi:hypothetical protein